MSEDISAFGSGLGFSWTSPLGVQYASNTAGLLSQPIMELLGTTTGITGLPASRISYTASGSRPTGVSASSLANFSNLPITIV